MALPNPYVSVLCTDPSPPPLGGYIVYIRGQNCSLFSQGCARSILGSSSVEKKKGGAVAPQAPSTGQLHRKGVCCTSLKRYCILPWLSSTQETFEMPPVFPLGQCRAIPDLMQSSPLQAINHNLLNRTPKVT